MARSPYKHAKRQKELAKKKKQEEKRQRKLDKKTHQQADDTNDDIGQVGEAAEESSSPEK